MSSMRERIRAAVDAHDFVEIERAGLGVPDRRTHGYPVGVGEGLVLINIMGDRIDLDGYEVLRLADITACELEFPRKAFYVKALSLKGEARTTPGELNLSGMRPLLVSAHRAFPLLVIHREHIAPGECEVGRIKLTSDEAFALHYIDPSATWADDPGHYRYADVTRVGFGGEYETTLALVAGVAV